MANTSAVEHRGRDSIGKLKIRLVIAIALAATPPLLADIWYSVESTRKTSLEQITGWAVLTGQSVRVTLNNLMRDGRMDSRFAMLENMREEIAGLEDIRLIRSPRVDELFMKKREEEAIPREQKAIDGYRKDIAALREELAQASDEDDHADLEDEITWLKESMQAAEENIRQLRQITSDEREQPKDELDLQVLNTGEPVNQVVGDRMRVLAPFKVREEGCTEASGCHQGAKPGEVLGAINLEFSIADLNAQIQQNALGMGGIKLLFGLFIIGAMFLILNRMVINSVRKLLQALKRMGEGDLTVRIESSGRLEMQEVAHGFNEFAERIGSAIREISSATHNLSTASEEMLAISAQIASGAEQQGSKVHSVANASEELSATCQNVSQVSADMANTARGAIQIAREGDKVISDTINGMHGISKSSQDTSEVVTMLVKRCNEIASVLGLISDIANQTNLLALNAAIESARAGEYGRGFAVVADEVRNLACKTSQSTKDIAEMLKEIQVEADKAFASMTDEQKVVEQGLGLAEEARCSLEGIVGQVSDISNQIQQVAAALEEQAIASQTISGDIKDIAVVTNDATTGAQNIAQSSKQLAELSVKLRGMVSQFKVAD